EAGLDRLDDDLVGVDRAATPHGLPCPLEGSTPRTGGAGRVAEEAAAVAATHDEPTVARRREVAVPLRVRLGDDQGHAAVLHPGASHATSGGSRRCRWPAWPSPCSSPPPRPAPGGSRPGGGRRCGRPPPP